VAESTPKKDGARPMEDGNASNNSDLSGYATANQSMEASGPATIPVGQLIDIPLQDTSNDVINFSQGFFFHCAEGTHLLFKKVYKETRQ